MEQFRKYAKYIEIPALFIFTFFVWKNDLLVEVSLFIPILFLFNVLVLKDHALNLYVFMLVPPLLSNISTMIGITDFEADNLLYYLRFSLTVFSGYSIAIFFTIKNRKNIKMTPITIGIIVFFATMIPSYFVTINMYKSLLILGVYLNPLIFYFYFQSSPNMNKDHLFGAIILLALQSAVQMFYIMGQGDAVDMILTKRIQLGWSAGNHIGKYLSFAFPLFVYFSVRYHKSTLIMYLGLFIVSIALLFTSYRTGWLSILVILPPLIVYIFRYTNKKRMIIGVSIFLVLATIIGSILYSSDLFQAVLERMAIKGLDDSSRFELWSIGFDHIIDYRFFGSGNITTGDYIGDTTSTYHNIFIDAWTNTGIIGLIGTVFFLATIVKQLRQNKTDFNFFISLGLLTMFVSSLIDVAHLNPITLMIFFPTIAFIEWRNVGNVLKV